MAQNAEKDLAANEIGENTCKGWAKKGGCEQYIR